MGRRAWGFSYTCQAPEPKWRNWQTRYVQGVVGVLPCGFESLLRHQLSRPARRGTTTDRRIAAQRRVPDEIDVASLRSSESRSETADDLGVRGQRGREKHQQTKSLKMILRRRPPNVKKQMFQSQISWLLCHPSFRKRPSRRSSRRRKGHFTNESGYCGQQKGIENGTTGGCNREQNCRGCAESRAGLAGEFDSDFC